MRFTLIVPASLASVMASPLAAPSPDIDESFLDHLTDGEAHVIKRSATISARDVELAQREGVDLGQSKFELSPLTESTTRMMSSVSTLRRQA
jgi:hypothetical protein